MNAIKKAYSEGQATRRMGGSIADPYYNIDAELSDAWHRGFMGLPLAALEADHE